MGTARAIATQSGETVEAVMCRLTESDHSSELTSACHYHLAAGGKRTRGRLAEEYGRAINIPAQRAVAIAASVELLHNASLIHDDIQDQDAERRGRRSLWVVFGKNTALCAGDAMITAAIAALAESASPRLAPQIAALHAAVQLTVAGQVEDLKRGVNEFVSLQEYCEVARAKSGPLLALPLELSLLEAGEKLAVKTAKQLCSDFALAYQIVDDLEDWVEDGLRGDFNILRSRQDGNTVDRRFAIELAAAQLERALDQADKIPGGFVCLPLVKHLQKRLQQL
jgi:geranylgeranyl diphosphate synthase type II